MATATCCFDSASVIVERVLEALPKTYQDRCTTLRNKLSYLRIFHQCATKWGNDDATLRPLLFRIENTVSGIARYAPAEVYDDSFLNVFHNGNELLHRLRHYVEYSRTHIAPFEKEINEWYIKFSDCSSQSYSQDSDHELKEFIGSLLGTLDFLCYDNYSNSALLYLLDALKDNLIFLKNFICFAKLRGGIDQSLMIHIKAVAICAAHHCYMCQFGERNNMFDKDDIPEMKFKIAGLLQRIKPVDPPVFGTYIQALNASKSSRQFHTPTLEIMGDFISSLLFYLFEILRDGTNPVLSTKNDRLHILYEGLRSLRTILKKQPKNFDKKTWDLIRVVVCDAGLVIFSLFPDATEDGFAQKMDYLLADMLERFKLIRVKVVGVFPERGPSMFNFPKVDELGFIDFLLENLTDQLSNYKETAGSTTISKHQIQIIHEELVFFRSFLEKIVLLRDEKDEIRILWNRVVELAYRIEFLIHSLVIGGVPHDSSFLVSFDFITREITNLKLDALKLSDKKGVHKVIKKSINLMPLELEISTPKIEDDIVGFNKVAASIISQLKTGAPQLQIVGIVGMAGIGKTTLAKMIYNDHSVISHFHVLAWCCISQVYNKKNILFEILKCISSKLPEKNNDEEDLAQKVRQELMKKRYLIILDDIWSMDAWDSLRASFPDDKNKSRILLTSRHQDVVYKLDQKPHFLCQLTEDECLELLKAKLGCDWPPNLYELRTQIVQKCGRLPLTIVILARILAAMEQNRWKEVVERLCSSTTPILEQCNKTLELSYIYLPDKLKPCFLYFGAFPKDQEFTPDKLASLWIAEGFVRKTQSQSLEDEAKDYLKQLISRSLIIVDKRSSIGHIKTCRIHDLLHEFCVEKAKEERFFQLLQGNEELSIFDEPYARRVCIHSKPEHFKESRLFFLRVRSVLFFNSDKWVKETYFNPLLCVGMSKFVNVLNLSQIPLGFNFPSEIGLLVQLSYLEVGGHFRSIPSSIANLSNLETLIVHLSGSVDLPDNVWSLKKLRHLQSFYGYDFNLPSANLDNSAELCNLDTLSAATIYWKNLEKILTKFPNIRKLKCHLSTSAGYSQKACLVFDHFSRLESLNFTSGRLYMEQQIEVSFPSNLRKLTVTEIGLPWSKMSAIGKLPNLVVLKLLYGAFDGKDWNIEESGQFPKLEFLKLCYLNIVKWTISESLDDPFPSLVKLVLDRCNRLEEVPSCLKDSSSLLMIEMSQCSDSALSSIKQIQEEQESMGNEDFKVLIRS